MLPSLRAVACRSIPPAALLALLAACGGGTPSFADAGLAADGAPAALDAAIVIPVDAAPVDPTEQIFSLDRLHRVDLQVEGIWLGALDADRENRVPCTITFDGFTLEGVGIRQKGGIGSVSSLSGKPGFSVKLDEFSPGQELHGLDKLILNNSIQDPTFLHEHVGYELARMAGLKAHRTAHALVTLNGDSYGLYVLAEPADGKFLRRNFGAGDDDGNLYEGACCGDFVNDPNHLELKHELDEMRNRGDVFALSGLVRSVSDDAFVSQVGPYLDLDTFITGFVLDAALVHWDGYAYNVNNHYIYHRPSDDRLVFMPHGMDQLLQAWDFDPYTWPQGRIAQRVLEIPELRARFTEELRRLVDDVWDTDQLIARIERVRTLIAGVTPMDDRTRNDFGSFEANFADTRQALIERRDRLSSISGAVCGDGMIGGIESCDDGNADVGDGCSPACTWEFCGDGVVQPMLGEVCDGGTCLPDCSGIAECMDLPAPTGIGTYTFCPLLVDIYAARADCATRGALLASPQTPEEQAFVTAQALALADIEFWIGIDDEAVEGDWRLADGTAATWFRWGGANPNGGDADDCVAGVPAYGGDWADRWCGTAYAFVCYRP